MGTLRLSGIYPLSQINRCNGERDTHILRTSDTPRQLLRKIESRVKRINRALPAPSSHLTFLTERMRRMGVAMPYGGLRGGEEE